MYFQAENLSSALVLLCKELMDKGIDVTSSICGIP